MSLLRKHYSSISSGFSQFTHGWQLFLQSTVHWRPNCLQIQDNRIKHILQEQNTTFKMWLLLVHVSPSWNIARIFGRGHFRFTKKHIHSKLIQCFIWRISTIQITHHCLFSRATNGILVVVLCCLSNSAAHCLNTEVFLKSFKAVGFPIHLVSTPFYNLV